MPFLFISEAHTLRVIQFSCYTAFIKNIIVRKNSYVGINETARRLCTWSLK